MANPAILAGAAAVGAVVLIKHEPGAYAFGPPTPVPQNGKQAKIPPRTGSSNRDTFHPEDPGLKQINTAAKAIAKDQWDALSLSAKQGVIDDLKKKYPVASAALKNIDLKNVKSFDNLNKAVGAGAGVAVCTYYSAGAGAAASPLCGAAGAVAATLGKKATVKTVRSTVAVIKAPVTIVKHPVSSAKSLVKAPVKIVKSPVNSAKKVAKKLKFW